MPKKPFEKILQHKAGQYEPAPKPDLWARIEQQLPQPKRKKRALWWWFSGAAVLLAAMFWMHTANAPLPADKPTQQPHTAATPGAKQEVAQPQAAQPQPTTQPQTTTTQTPTANNSHPTPTAAPKTKAAPQHKTAKQQPVPMPKKFFADIPWNNKEGMPDNPDYLRPKASNADRHNPNGMPNRRPDTTTNTQNTPKETPTTPIMALKDTAAAPPPTVAADSSPRLIPKKQKWQLWAGLQAAPLLSGLRLSLDAANNADMQAYQNALNTRKQTDKKSLHLAAGLQLAAQKGRHRFSFGLHHTTVGTKMLVTDTTPQFANTGSAINWQTTARTDTFELAQPNNGHYVQSAFRYWSLPLAYTYLVLNRADLKLGITAQISYQLQMQHKGLVYQPSTGYMLRTNSQAVRHAFGSAAAITFLLKTGKRTHLSLQPTLGTFWHPTEKAPLRQYPYYFALQAGFCFKINKVYPYLQKQPL